MLSVTARTIPKGVAFAPLDAIDAASRRTFRSPAAAAEPGPSAAAPRPYGEKVSLRTEVTSVALCAQLKYWFST